MSKRLIYEEDAIDALFELYEYQRDIDPTEAADLVRQGIFLAEKKIENMPSAQIIEEINKWLDPDIDSEIAVERIRDLIYHPSAQPEHPTGVQDILQYLDEYLHPIVSPEHWSVYSELYDMVSMLPSAQPHLDTCPIYGGMCGYPSNLCYECPRHGGAHEKPQWWTEGLQPFAQPERILAHWETVKNADGASIDFRCSACHRFRFHNGELRKYKFCPNCGAEIEQSTGNG